MSGRKGTILTMDEGQDGHKIRIDSKYKEDDIRCAVGLVFDYDPNNLPEGVELGDYVEWANPNPDTPFNDIQLTISKKLELAIGTIQEGDGTILISNAGDTLAASFGNMDIAATITNMDISTLERVVTTVSGFRGEVQCTYDTAAKSVDALSIR